MGRFITWPGSLVTWACGALIALGLGLGVAPPAAACSVWLETNLPSNFELVQVADAIAVGQAEVQEGKPFEGVVRMRTLEVLKGAPPSTFTAGGSFGRPRPSDPGRLDSANEEASAGGCQRSTFAKGGRYVVFLERLADGSYTQLRIPFARVNEDYFGEDSLWVRTIRTYLAIQQKSEAEQLDALKALMRQKLSTDRSAEAVVQAKDILAHLKSLSQFKPTALLLDVYAAAESGRPLPTDLEVVLAGLPAPAVEAVMAQLPDEQGVVGPFPPTTPETIERAALVALVVGRHADALPLFERLAAEDDLSPGKLGALVRFLARNGQYPRAFDLIVTRALPRLPALADVEMKRLIEDVFQAQQGDSYERGQERWRSDPRAAKEWPELALALYWLEVRAFGPDAASNLDDAITSIPVTDYRARPLLTLALASDHNDEKIGSWAIAELSRAPRPARDILDVTDTPDYLPIQILVRSHRDASRRALERAACEAGDRRLLVIKAIGEWGGYLNADLLKRIAALHRLSEEEQAQLEFAAAAMTNRAMQPILDPSYELLRQVIRGERIDLGELKPLSCG